MKNLMKITFVAAIAAVAGYNVYQSQSVMNGMSEFALANVEALATGEMQIKCDGSVLITCEEYCTRCHAKWTAIGGRGFSLGLEGDCECGASY